MSPLHVAGLRRTHVREVFVQIHHDLVLCAGWVLIQKPVLLVLRLSDLRALNAERFLKEMGSEGNEGVGFKRKVHKMTAFLKHALWCQIWYNGVHGEFGNLALFLNTKHILENSKMKKKWLSYDYASRTYCLKENEFCCNLKEDLKHKRKFR